ncbi:hypothetical protein IHC87_18315 [Photobacterium damselae subsp. damselae]|uniref:hypothetical protein n=1 Tax=Photobacterium damselae TaxID=38293 RepID=UPI001F386C81|nr:hypothetical protein [Photobacterium damselae]UJZ95409.1 hypothetical protein IHC87_18315 [Photobacterium damselae subsp. damselae]UJZ99576.1 hypothetical protein IHC88_19175 [Photobacterium damselae subsp. damselae]
MKNQNKLMMTRYNNETYCAPKFYSAGHIKYVLWKDECNKKYIQMISGLSYDQIDLNLNCSNYFFPLDKIKNNLIYFDSLWGFNGNFELKKVKNINVFFNLKSIINHYTNIVDI